MTTRVIIGAAASSASWTRQTPVPATASNLFSVANSGSLYVAVGAGGAVITSPNGQTWTAQNSTVSDSFNEVVYNSTSGLFIAVGGSSALIRSSNGVTWSSTPISGSIFPQSIVWSERNTLLQVLSVRSGHLLMRSLGQLEHQA